MTRLGHGNFAAPGEIAKGAVGSLYPKDSEQERAQARAEVCRQATDAEDETMLLAMLGLGEVA